jgi:hypothetical protein
VYEYAWLWFSLVLIAAHLEFIAWWLNYGHILVVSLTYVIFKFIVASTFIAVVTVINKLNSAFVAVNIKIEDQK